MAFNLFRNRPGLTPIVSIVLLLMMVVALAGALFTWVTQIQEGTQEQFRDRFQTDIESRAIDCIIDEDDDEHDLLRVSLRNTGERQIDASSVDIYVFDQDQSLYMLMSDDWSDKYFTEPGDFDDVEIQTDGTFEPDGFYMVTVDFPRANTDVRVGGCIAE